MQRRQQRAAFKAKGALEALRGERTRHEWAATHGVPPVHITQWKKVLLEEVPTLFSSRRGAKPKEADDGLVAAPRLRGQSHTGRSAAAAEGVGSARPHATAQPARGGPCNLSVALARGERGPGQPGVERS